MTADAVAGFVALGSGALVLSRQRSFSPAVPAIAAPIAVVWPHGAPALGAGVALGALLLGSPKRLPGPAFLLAVAFAVAIAVAGDGGLVRGGAIAIAAIAGAPFTHAPWRTLSAFSDTYHRVGTTGVVLFVLLLLATGWGLPRPFAPGLVAAAVGAICVPVEATAPLWLLAGFAATGDSPDGPLRRARDEERLQAGRDALRDERPALNRRRIALDEREAALARRERGLAPGPPPQPPEEPPEERLQPEFRHWNLRVLRSLVEARGAEFPDRIEEWRVYLELLEPFAENGVLGPAFDETIVEVSGPLVA